MSVEIKLSLTLPRDELTVPVVRHVCRFALQEVGALPASIADLELALTEACANVVDHSAADDEYEVDIAINDRECVIRVRDAGRGFDPATLDGGTAEPSAESGRGIELMSALVDRIRFTSKPEVGMIVRLEKELAFDEEAPIRKALADRNAG